MQIQFFRLYQALGLGSKPQGFGFWSGWFCRCLGELLAALSQIPPFPPPDPDSPAEPQWADLLQTRIYQRDIGPALWARRACFHGQTRELLCFWRGIKEACRWLAHQGVHGGIERGDGPRVELLFPPGHSISFSSPSMDSPLTLTNLPDLVFRLGEDELWTVAGLSPEPERAGRAEARACFYHALLAGTGRVPDEIRLLSFGHGKTETRLTRSRLRPGKEPLKAALVHLARTEAGSPAPPGALSPPLPEATLFFSRIRPQLPRNDGKNTGCGQILLGVDGNGRLHLADMDRPFQAHFLVSGGARQAKRQWLEAALAAAILANSPANLQVCSFDPQGLLPPESANSPYFARNSNGLFRLKALEDLLKQRNSGPQNASPRLIFVCMDYELFLEQEGAGAESRIFELAVSGPGQAIHLILLCQDANGGGGLTDAAIPACLAFNRGLSERLPTGKQVFCYQDQGNSLALTAPYLPPHERIKVFEGKDFLPPQPFAQLLARRQNRGDGDSDQWVWPQSQPGPGRT